MAMGLESVCLAWITSDDRPDMLRAMGADVW